MNNLLEHLAQSLGVPERIFRGDPNSSSFSAADHDEYWRRMNEWRSRILASLLPAQHRIVEQHFPEMYWEPMFLCSPRGFMRIRRKQPLTFKVEWKP